MTPETKKAILQSYECQLKASGKPDKIAEYEKIIAEIKAIPTTEEVLAINTALECTLALDMPHREGQALLISHGYVDANRFEEPATMFVNSMCKKAQYIIKNILNTQPAKA